MRLAPDFVKDEDTAADTVLAQYAPDVLRCHADSAQYDLDMPE
jgi:hypothetical protein